MLWESAVAGLDHNLVKSLTKNIVVVPQRNPGLAAADWEDVALPESLIADGGVVNLDRPKTAEREFFRLRRVE